MHCLEVPILFFQCFIKFQTFFILYTVTKCVSISFQFSFLQFFIVVTPTLIFFAIFWSNSPSSNISRTRLSVHATCLLLTCLLCTPDIIQQQFTSINRKKRYKSRHAYDRITWRVGLGGFYCSLITKFTNTLS